MTRTERHPGPPFPLTFSLPMEFSAVDLHADSTRRAADLEARITRNVPSLSVSQRMHLVAVQETMITRMIIEGVLYFATLLARSETGLPVLSTAQFTVTVKDAPFRHGNPSLPDLLSALGKRPNAEAQYVDLEIGRCVAVLEDVTYRLDRDIMGEANPNDHRVRQLQVVFPLTDRGQIAMFGLSTESIDDWDDYVTMMAGICKTIRWTESATTSAISAVLG